MNKIITLEEAVREKQNQLSELALRQFRNSIRPIYGSTENENPIHIGTCTFLKLNNKHYLITAAHVLDENTNTTLYIAGEKSLVKLEGNANQTTKIDNERENDHYDIAWMELSEETKKSIGKVSFIGEENIIYRDVKTEGRLYVALGYPNSKNKKVNNISKSIKPKIWRYSSTVKENKELCEELKISGEHHYFLDYNSKYSRDSEGNKMSSMKPIGMSGGALIDMCSLINLEKYKQGSENNGFLAAILIENQKKYKSMVCVRLSLILDQIKNMTLI